MTTDLCTIGFSQKNLRKFVELLEHNNVSKLVDTRLNNTSQLSGYSKKDDLEYVMELRNIEYVHEPLLAPTEDILKAYKKKEINWETYEKRYIDLLKERNIKEIIDEIIGNKTICLLCSEHKPHQCHRRLLAEYINIYRKDVNIIHLT
jgi:uncharacterized protein (DUF488 family)